MKEKMRSLEKVIAFIIAVAMVVALFPVIPVNAGSSSRNVTLYYAGADELEAMGLDRIPSGYMTSYQINLGGFTNPTIKVVEGCSVSVSKDGLVTPICIPLGRAKSLGYTASLDDIHFRDTTSNSLPVYVPYPTTIEVSDGSQKIVYHVTPKAYADVYVNEKLNQIVEDLNLSDYDTQYDKLDAITKYVADNTAYSYDYSLLNNMVLYSKGDCIASSQMTKALCIKAGISKVKIRRSYQDQNGEGNGHVNLYAELDDGNSYISDVYAGVIGTTGRGYRITNCSGHCMTGETYYQYDGILDSLVIPEKVNGTTVTTIGRTDRFDSNKYASIFYNTDRDCTVLSLRIPATVSTIHPGAFSGNDYLESISIDENNPYYASKDNLIYSKDLSVLYYVPPVCKEIKIDSNVTSVDPNAFIDNSNCSIYYDGTESDWENIFTGTLPEGVKLYYGTVRVDNIATNYIGTELSFDHYLDQLTLNCIVLPVNAANQEIKYSSTDENVAIVVGSTVYAIGEGKCQIIATSVDGGHSIEFNVNNVFKGYTLTVNGGVIVDGNGDKLSTANILEGTKVTIRPDGTYDDFKEWKIPDGVEGVGNTDPTTGEVSFTMPAKDVTIDADYFYSKVNSVDSISSSSGSDTICEGDTFQLVAKVSPSYAHNKNMSWSVRAEDTGILSIDENGMATALCSGTARVTATTTDGSNKSCTGYIHISPHTSDAEKTIIQVGDCIETPYIVEYYCTNCQKTIREVIPPDGEHSWDEGTVIREVTCEQDGEILYTCLACNATKTEFVKGGHDYQNVDKVEPTCTEKGYEAGVVCTRCQDVKSGREEIAPLGHDYQNVAEEAPTCTEKGYEAGVVCTRCQDVKSGCEEIPALGHDYVVTEKKVDPTCTECGYTASVSCSRCGKVKTARTKINPKGHNWGDWEVTKAATTTSTGIETRVCKNDPKHIENRIIDKLPDEGGNGKDSGNDQGGGNSSGGGNDQGNGNNQNGGNGSGSGNDKKDNKPSYSNEWIDGKWYNADGTQTYEGTLQWKSDATGWWVEDTDGWYPTDTWQKIDGVWYYFKPSGYMAMGEYYGGYWFNGDGSWDEQYYLSWKSDATGWWVEDISGWWPSSSWLQIDGYWYYFLGSGYMATSQYVDGYWIGADGTCQ